MEQSDIYCYISNHTKIKRFETSVIYCVHISATMYNTWCLLKCQIRPGGPAYPMLWGCSVRIHLLTRGWFRGFQVLFKLQWLDSKNKYPWKQKAKPANFLSLDQRLAHVLFYLPNNYREQILVTHTSQYLCYAGSSNHWCIKVHSSLNVCDVYLLCCLRLFNTALGNKKTQDAWHSQDIVTSNPMYHTNTKTQICDKHIQTYWTCYSYIF